VLLPLDQNSILILPPATLYARLDDTGVFYVLKRSSPDCAVLNSSPHTRQSFLPGVAAAKCHRAEMEPLRSYLAGRSVACGDPPTNVPHWYLRRYYITHPP
jgi:hypothetical protein